MTRIHPHWCHVFPFFAYDWHFKSSVVYHTEGWSKSVVSILFWPSLKCRNVHEPRGHECNVPNTHLKCKSTYQKNNSKNIWFISCNINISVSFLSLYYICVIKDLKPVWRLIEKSLLKMYCSISKNILYELNSVWWTQWYIISNYRLLFSVF